MGNFKSIIGSRKKKENTIKSKSNHFSNDNNHNLTHDLELAVIRRTIDQNPELFILNNLMMCIQFFENFDEEIINIKQNLVSTREPELNSKLPSQKHVLVPDVLQEKVSESIDFTYVRPTSIPSVEPLQPIRIYITFDNIEVTEQNYTTPYCCVNETITYSMQLKPSRHKGYVLLQRLEVNPSKRKIYALSDEPIYSDGDSLYSNGKTHVNESAIVERDKKSDRSGSSSRTSPLSDVNDEESIYDVRENNAYGIVETEKEQHRQLKDEDTTNDIKKKKNLSSHDDQKSRQYPKIQGNCVDINISPGGSISSGYRSGNNAIDSDSECGYGLITLYKKSKGENLTINKSKFITEIPRQCFQIYDPMKDKRTKLNNKDRLIKGVIYNRKYDMWYLNSTKFMEYFYKIFNDQLSILMGFDNDIDDEPHGAFIYRDKFEILETQMVMKDDQFAIVPCIWSTWPDIADEWLIRPRATWPNYDIIKKIKEMGCYIIPEGYCDENSRNNLTNLEWELTFPAAERYLETCMSYSQVRVYLMALMLQKTFMRPLDSYIGLTGAHIRNQLFWLIEENDTASKWHDSRMGECLNILLKSIYRAISQDVPIMPDYFIRDKNIFQNNISLHRTQKQLKRIIENPIMYLLHTMQNIKYSSNFFPKLDYSMLLRILTDDILTLINPHLAAHQFNQSREKFNNTINKQYEHGGFWDSAKHTKEQNILYLKKPLTNKTLIDTRTSSDQVIEITVRCEELDTRRLCLLLDLFIQHFIKIAEYCNKYGAIIQQNIYIDHAERLSILLSENGNHRDDAKIYLNKLQTLRENLTKIRSQHDGPEIPKRNLDRSVYSSTLKDRYTNSIQSQQNLVKIDESGETSDYIIGESNDITCKSPSDVKKYATKAMVHESEIKSTITKCQRNLNEITINGSPESFQVISSIDRQCKSLETNNTYF